jgi:hypothetical protein
VPRATRIGVLWNPTTPSQVPGLQAVKAAGHIAKEATTSVSIVNGLMSDPVRAKLIDSLARPGGNLTGLTSASPDVSAETAADEGAGSSARTRGRTS